MSRVIEWLLGLERGFLGLEGDFALTFDPRWPGVETVGAATWNILLVSLATALVVWIYRRETGSRGARAVLGSIRLVLLLLVILMLNRPGITLTQRRVENSVVAVLIDDSQSMRLTDAGMPGTPQSRLDSARDLLEKPGGIVEQLGALHELRLFRFNADARPVEADAIAEIAPSGSSSDLQSSLRSAASVLRGTRLAGMVVLGDGRSTGAPDDRFDNLPRVVAIPLGSSAGFSNVSVDAVVSEDVVFVDDIVNIRVVARAVGIDADAKVEAKLVRADNTPLMEDGRAVAVTLVPGEEGLLAGELQFVPREVGPLDLRVEIPPLPGEVEEADNRRDLRLSVLDSQVAVLYVEGYPRWEYRFLRTELTRDRTITLSSLLTSADTTFAQEGDRPITRFPQVLDEILEYDVVLLGDVDPRQFTQSQLDLIAEFVGKRGGGFAMASGPQFAPHSYRGTPIEPLLPVEIARTRPDGGATNVPQGFRVRLTREGIESSVLRILRDPHANRAFFEEQVSKLFWFVQGVVPKPGVGTTLAEGPVDPLTDRPAALIVTGRFGAGRTLFSGIDDTWRWRYHTGESVFTSYWVQSLRYLARGRKLGQRRLTVAVERPAYEMGEIMRFEVRILDPQMGSTLSDELQATLTDARGVATPVRLTRSGSNRESFAGAIAAGLPGGYRFSLAAPGADALETTVEVVLPKLEMRDPRVDTESLERLARATGGAVVAPGEIATLAELLPSGRRVVPVLTTRELWQAPLTLAAFVVLIGIEWIGRKLKGLI
jgi:uncharacterized membrane protein